MVNFEVKEIFGILDLFLLLSGLDWQGLLNIFSKNTIDLLRN